MRTVVLDALMVDVQTAVGSLESARVVYGLEGKVWVQSPDFDRMKAAELEHFVEHMGGLGVTVKVLENQEPFPPGTDAPSVLQAREGE